jgi:hypothetical protein
MKREYTLHVNLFAPVVILVALFLGFSGMVSWWVILLIGISQVRYMVDCDFMM